MPSYSAGTAFLQVTPSFDKISKAFEQEAEKLGRQIDRAIAKSLPEGMAEASKQAKGEGERAGEAYAGAFATVVKRRVDAAVKAFGPIKVDADTSAVDRAIVHVQERLAKIRNGKVGFDFTAEGLFAEVAEIQTVLKNLEHEGVDIEVSTNLRTALSELDALQQVRRDGDRAGEAYAGAFDAALRRGLETAARTLPDIELDADTSEAQLEIAELKQDLSLLREVKIGVGVDKLTEEEFFAEIQRMVNKAEKLQREGVTIDIRHNAKAVRGQLEALQQIDKDSREPVGQGTRDGRRYGGAFGEAMRRPLEAALKALPEPVLGLKAGTAEAELARIHKKIQELSESEIDIDIPFEQYSADLATLEAALEALQRDEVDIRIRTNARAALAEIRKVRDAARGVLDSDPKERAQEGEEQGGAFAQAFQRALASGLSKLPEINLKDNTNEVDHRIAALRDQLTDLSGKKLGIDVDANKAFLTITQITAELKALAASDPRIDVHSNLLAVAADLQAVETMIDRLNNRKVDIKARIDRLEEIGKQADFSMTRLGFMISIGASIGPVIVPAAAAAAVAIGGIATAAGAAALGVGVLGLGLFGAVSAVGALNKYQLDAKKSAVGLGGAEDRVASAVDSVRNAQRGLVRAERERLQSIEALKQAQEDARRQLQDMALAVRSTALAQRQARLDEAQAKRELDKVLANKNASEEEREQARINHDERVLQLDELALKQERLAKDKEEADRKGVEGSDRVVAAQERIADATEGVLSAQESLAQAQRSMAQAYEKTGVAGGAALENLKDAMDQLSPQGQRFARFIFGLKDEFQQLQHAAEGGLLPGLETGLRSLLPFLPKVRSLVFSIGQALGDSFVDFTQQLRNPEWRKFFSFVGDTAVPALRGMAQFIFNITQGLASLIATLGPLNRGMGRGLLDMSEGFAKWAGQLEKSAGFQQFLGYVARVGPRVIDLLEQLGIFIVRLVVAAAPVGEVVVKIFDNLFQLLNSIPIETLTTLVSVIGVLSGVMLAASAVVKAYYLGVSLLTIIMKGASFATSLWSTATASFNGGARAATTNTNTFAQALAAQEGAATKSKSAMAGLAAFMGGPWGIALAVATIALGSFLAMQQRVKDEAASMGSALDNIANSFRGGGDAAVLELAKQDKAVAASIVQLRKFGVSSQDVFRAQQGDVKAQGRVLDSLRSEYAQLSAQHQKFMAEQNQKAAWLQDDDKINKDRERLDALTLIIEEQSEKYRAAKEAADAYGISTDEAAAANKRAEQASRIYGGQISALEDLYSALTASTYDSVAAADALRRFTDEATQSAMTITEAEEAHVRAMTELRTAFKENGTQLDLNTAKTDEQRRAVLASRDALEEALRAAREKTIADVESGKAIKDVNEAAAARIQKILEEIPATERNTDVVKSLVEQYGLIPGDILTKIQVDGAEAVLNKLKDLRVAQYALANNVTLAAARAHEAGDLNTFESQVPAAGRQARADGGYISGPGGPTDDVIPAWLSNGEYVMPASTVARYGISFFDDLRRGMPRFARGGSVVWPFPVDVEDTWMPSMEDLRKQWASTGAMPGFLPWPSSPGASRGDSGVWRNIVALVEQSGIRHEFGNSYRDGDPLWHGSGRAVDWMGYQQDQLGQFFMDMRPRVLELIHTTDRGGYYITRGVRKNSMGDQDELHRNHLHVAMDSGGWIEPGWNPPIWNGTGKPEPVLTNRQWSDIGSLARGGDGARASYSFQFRDTTLDPGKLRAIQAREDARNRAGRPR